AQRGWDRTPLRMLALGLIGQITIFGIGVPWLAIAAGYGPAEAIAAGFTPFLVGGAIKSLIAAAVLPLAWRAAHRRPRWSPRGSRAWGAPDPWVTDRAASCAALAHASCTPCARVVHPTRTGRALRAGHPGVPDHIRPPAAPLH